MTNPRPRWEDPAIAELFPASLAEIPARFRIDPHHHPARYQIGDEVITVERDELRTPVYSKVALRRGSSGALSAEPILLGYTPVVGAAEAERAVALAVKAWADPAEAKKWRRASWETRIEAVRALTAALSANLEVISTLLMFEIGKVYADAKKEVTRSVEYIENTITVLRTMLEESGRTYYGESGKVKNFARDVLHPSGVALCVGPFNYPINEFLTTVVPALLMGNPVIAKTPRFGALANQVLMEVCAASFPPGVLSMLPGDGKEIIPPIIAARGEDVFGKVVAKVRTLAFIGSEGAANAIAARHPAQNFLTKILGLGAKNPAVICAGGDYSDEDVGKWVKGALGNNGQRCTAEKIFFVPEGAEGDALVERIAERVSGLAMGMPWVDGVAVTPLPEDRKVELMHEYIDDAVERGARIANAGGGAGWFSMMRPAVVDRVGEGMRLHFEEQFGPILAIRRYRDVREALDWERRSPFGQQAAIWGKKNALRDELVAAFLDEVARLNINDICQRGPDSFGFTATEKSGYGTLSLRDALLAFSRTTILQSPELSNFL